MQKITVSCLKLPSWIKVSLCLFSKVCGCRWNDREQSEVGPGSGVSSQRLFAAQGNGWRAEECPDTPTAAPGLPGPGHSLLGWDQGTTPCPLVARFQCYPLPL